MADRRPPSRPAAGPGQRRRLRGRLARLFRRRGEVFGKTAQDLNINDPGVVAPALFELVYTTPRPIWRSNAGTRDAPRGCHGTSCASPSVRFSWEPTRSAPDKLSATFCRSLTPPVYHLRRDPAQAERMRHWFAHPKSKVDSGPYRSSDMQDRKDDVNAAVTAWIDAL